MLRSPIYFYIENIWHQFQLDWTERGGWVLPFGATRAWVELHIALWLPMLQCFPTVLSYTHTQCSIHCARPLERGPPHSVHRHAAEAEPLQGRVSRPYAGCWGLTFMCWGCPNRPIRCFCFLCSVIWEHRRDRFLNRAPSVPLSARMSSSAEHAGLRSSSIHSFVSLCRN